MNLKKIYPYLSEQTCNDLEHNFSVIAGVLDLIFERTNEEKLTTEQFAELTTLINGLIKKGEVTVSDINLNLGKIGLAHLSDEVIKAIAGTANVNAIVADDSITTNKLFKGAVTPEKTSFISTSTNLFNKDDVYPGKQLDSTNGQMVDNSAVSVMKKSITVYPGEQFTTSGINTRCFYDASGNFISGNLGNSTFTIPPNARQMKVSVVTTSLNVAQINKGASLLSYEPYFPPYFKTDIEVKSLPTSIVKTENVNNGAVTPQKVSFIEPTINLIDNNKATKGYALDTSGNPVVNISQAYSDYYPIEPNTVYSADTGGTSGRTVFYDSSRKIINVYSGTTMPYTFTTPPNAVEARSNIYGTKVGTAMINKGTSIKPFEEWRLPQFKGINFDNVISNTSDKSKLKDFNLDAHLDLKFSSPEIDSVPTSSSVSEYYSKWDALLERNPNYITKRAGVSDGFGNTINTYEFSPEKADYANDSSISQSRPFRKPRILLMSSTHGAEKTVIWALYNAMRLVCDEWKSNEALEFLRWNVDFVIVPITVPTGYINNTRKNANGVDISRNYTADWSNGPSDPNSESYRGPSALSEKESQYIDSLMKNEEFDFVVDFHNFFSPSKSEYFNWLIGSSPLVNNIATSYIERVSRDWKKRYTDLPQDKQFGWVSPMINAGLVTNHALKTYGISSCLYECSYKLDVKPNSTPNDTFIATIATDGLVKFLLSIVNNIEKM